MQSFTLPLLAFSGLAFVVPAEARAQAAIGIEQIPAGAALKDAASLQNDTDLGSSTAPSVTADPSCAATAEEREGDPERECNDAPRSAGVATGAAAEAGLLGLLRPMGEGATVPGNGGGSMVTSADDVADRLSTGDVRSSGGMQAVGAVISQAGNGGPR